MACCDGVYNIDASAEYRYLFGVESTRSIKRDKKLSSTCFASSGASELYKKRTYFMLNNQIQQYWFYFNIVKKTLQTIMQIRSVQSTAKPILPEWSPSGPPP